MTTRPEVGTVGQLMGIARFTFHEGKVEEFKRLSEQCMEIVRAQDTGTLQYDIYVNDDESEAIVIERYADTDGLVQHLAHIGDLMQAIMMTADIHGELLGDPSAELRAQMDGSPVQLFAPLLSMERSAPGAQVTAARGSADAAPGRPG